VGRVVIGMDPHKRSATIEIIDDQETVLGGGRFGTDRDGYRAMLAAGRRHPQRIWAVEGCYGIGRHIAQRLVADGETVVDVPPKLSARVRVFATGQGRKTDPVDAHSVAVAALRAKGLRQVAVDDETVALRLLVDLSCQTAATSSAGPAPTCSTASTSCCWSCCPAERRRSCAPIRPAPCWPPSDPATSSVAPAGGWPAS
jgi:Transposase